VSQPEIAKKIIKNLYFGGSRSFKIIDVDISKTFVTIACYDKRLPAQASLNRRSRFGLLKSMFNAENFICRLSWSISSHFVAI